MLLQHSDGQDNFRTLSCKLGIANTCVQGKTLNAGRVHVPLSFSEIIYALPPPQGMNILPLRQLLALMIKLTLALLLMEHLLEAFCLSHACVTCHRRSESHGSTLPSADLGFFVAIDGAMRIPRNLPSAALTTFAPPGSFYQVDNCKLLLCPQAVSTWCTVVNCLYALRQLLTLQQHATLLHQFCTAFVPSGGFY